MIVVVGSPAWRAGEPGEPAGRTCDVALAAVRAGARVEVVGRVGDDPMGDRLLIALGLAGVGHAAVLRDPARRTPVLPTRAEPEAIDDESAGDDSTPASPPDPADPALQPADVALGLQYLTAFAVLVVADDVPPEALPACVEGASFAGAALVVLVADGVAPPAGIPASATVIAAPPDDEGAVARMVGRYAARLDTGDEPAAAFQAALDDGWETPVP